MKPIEVYNLVNTALEVLNKVDVNAIPIEYEAYFEVLLEELKDFRDFMSSRLPRKDITVSAKL